MTGAQIVDKVIFKQRKSLENKEFSKWNPQTEFTSVEENQGFQSIYADGTLDLFFCFSSSKSGFRRRVSTLSTPSKVFYFVSESFKCI